MFSLPDAHQRGCALIAFVGSVLPFHNLLSGGCDQFEPLDCIKPMGQADANCFQH